MNITKEFIENKSKEKKKSCFNCIHCHSTINSRFKCSIKDNDDKSKYFNIADSFNSICEKYTREE